MLKPFPRLTSDDEAEEFLVNANLAEYDLSGFRRVHFEFAPKVKQVNMRMAEDLLIAVKARAAAVGMSYQRFIRLAIEQALSRPLPKEPRAPAE
jgi:predicted DNA binding CopG/RHH family protein